MSRWTKRRVLLPAIGQADAAEAEHVLAANVSNKPEWKLCLTGGFRSGHYGALSLAPLDTFRSFLRPLNRLIGQSPVRRNCD
jgi:hypothetical protein